MKTKSMMLAVVLTLAACGGDDDPPPTTDVDSGVMMIMVDSGGFGGCELCWPSCTEAMSTDQTCAPDTPGPDCSGCVPPCDTWEMFFGDLDLAPYCDSAMMAHCVDASAYDDTGPWYLEPSLQHCVPR